MIMWFDDFKIKEIENWKQSFPRKYLCNEFTLNISSFASLSLNVYLFV